MTPAEAPLSFSDLATAVELPRLHELLEAVTDGDATHALPALLEWDRVKRQRLREAVASGLAHSEDVADFEHLIMETMRSVPGMQYVSNE